jgi:hypothetical protein
MLRKRSSAAVPVVAVPVVAVLLVLVPLVFVVVTYFEADRRALDRIGAPAGTVGVAGPDRKASRDEMICLLHCDNRVRTFRPAPGRTFGQALDDGRAQLDRAGYLDEYPTPSCWSRRTTGTVECRISGVRDGKREMSLTVTGTIANLPPQLDGYDQVDPGPVAGAEVTEVALEAGRW